jgi:hypothetical protein
VTLWHIPCDDPASAAAPREALEIFFMNGTGASLVGGSESGVFAAIPKDLPDFTKEGEGVSSLWDKRHIADYIPAGETSLKVLVQKGALGKIYEIFNELSDGCFFSLHTMVGILVLMTGKGEITAHIQQRIHTLPHVYEMPA